MTKRPSSYDEVLDDTTLGELLEAIPPQTPPPGLRAKVLARALGPQSLADFITVRNEGAWHALIPGIDYKMLIYDAQAGSKSFLLRAAAGVSMPAHTHSATEECLVLQGEFSMGEINLRTGDFHCAAAGVTHEAAYTPNGVLVYIRAGINDYPGIDP